LCDGYVELGPWVEDTIPATVRGEVGGHSAVVSLEGKGGTPRQLRCAKGVTGVGSLFLSGRMLIWSGTMACR
jgi:hypothetical protein